MASKVYEPVKEYLENKCAANGGKWQESVRSMTNNLSKLYPKYNWNTFTVYQLTQQLEEEGVIEITEQDGKKPNIYAWIGLAINDKEMLEEVDSKLISKIEFRLQYYRERVSVLENEIKQWQDYEKYIIKKDVIGDTEVIYRDISRFKQGRKNNT